MRSEDDKLLKILKIVMVVGILLFLFGHYLLSYYHIEETMGVAGLVIGASCMAFGLILSLPTKIYLTILMMKREAEKDKNSAKPPL